MSICVIGTANVSNCIVCTTPLTYMAYRVIRATTSDVAIRVIGTADMTHNVVSATALTRACA